MSRLVKLLAALAVSSAVMLIGAAPVAAAPAADSPAKTEVPGIKVPANTRFVLPNGLTIVLVPNKDVPLIAFAGFVRGGALADPAGKNGVGSLVAGLLDRGAGKRNAYEFADAVEGVGGSFSAAAGAEAINVSGQFLARDRALMIELLADALMRPRLDADEFSNYRDREIEFIKSAKDSDPSQIIGIYGRAALFGTHPYGRPQGGSERSLAGITQSDVVAYHAANFGADRTTLVFAGDLDAKWMKQALTTAFGGWAKAKSAAPTLGAPARVSGRRVVLIDAPGSVQTYFWFGNVGVDRRYNGRPALDLVNTLYGGRFTSILNTELRIKSGLTYGASSRFTRATVPGEFAIRSFTQTDTTGQALDLALKTLDDLKHGALAPEMLESARSYVLGQYPLQLETAAHWAAALSDLEFYGLGKDYIEGYFPALQKVDLSETSAVTADAFPRPTDLVIVLIGDAAKIREVAAKYGTVTEMKLSDPDFGPGAATK
ncbi:MAG TPA: pitrilysin family protein [Steroidobacteraceae bacterium]|nr:pitrilysin family protein [Steroidobacteraceae bacterium]